MNTLKNFFVIFIGNILASLSFVSIVSLQYAIKGGFEAYSLIGWIVYIIFFPLILGTITFSVIYNVGLKDVVKRSVLELVAFVSYLISLIITDIIIELINDFGLITLFFVWSAIYLGLSFALVLIGRRLFIKFGGVGIRGMVIINVVILIISGMLIYYAQSISIDNEASELPLPVISCTSNNDCSALDCSNRGHKWYCDSNGFPKCGSNNICTCAFVCL